jgi:hypothetical protein
MSIIIENIIEQSSNEPVLYFDKIYKIHDQLVMSKKIDNKLNKVEKPDIECIDRESDFVVVDMNDPLIKNKKTYWNSFDCSFDFIFLCCM